MSDISPNDYRGLLDKIYNLNVEMNERIGKTETLLERLSMNTDQRIITLEKEIEALRAELERRSVISWLKRHWRSVLVCSTFGILFWYSYTEYLKALDPDPNPPFYIKFIKEHL